MGDERLRELERRWGSSRSEEDEAAYKNELARTQEGYLPAKRIETPSYAGEPRLDLEEGGEASCRAFQERFPAVLERLRLELERSFNDPEIVFSSAEGGFPLKSALSGEFYFAGATYGSWAEEGKLLCRGFFMLHCLEQGRVWENQPPDHDYLGMEMIVYLDPASGGIEFEEEFTSSSI